MNTKMLLIAIVSLAMCSCKSMGRFEQHSTIDPTKESVLVLGVTPPNGFRVYIFPGKIEEGEFVQSKLANAVFAGHPEDGYVVARLHVGETAAITAVSAVKDKDAVKGDMYKVCDDAKTKVFISPTTGGQVLYVGDIHVEQVDRRKVVPSFSSNLPKAAQYVDSHFPELAGRVKPLDYQLMKTQTPCQDFYVPIYYSK